MPQEEEVPENSFVDIEEEKPDLRKKEQPLVRLIVTNPVSYLKSWWRRVIGNEGMELRFRVKPLTAIAITVIVVTVILGIGTFKLPFDVPFFVYSSKASPTPTPIETRETAFTGVLRYSTVSLRYYLETVGSESINLDVPETVDLESLVGRRILATGTYYLATRTLVVVSVEDLEILPKETEPIPTFSPTPEPVETETPSSSPSATPEAS